MNSKIWSYKNQGVIDAATFIETAEKFLKKEVNDLEDQSYFIVQVLPLCTFTLSNCAHSGNTGTATVVISALIIYK